MILLPNNVQVAPEDVVAIRVIKRVVGFGWHVSVDYKTYADTYKWGQPRTGTTTFETDSILLVGATFEVIAKAIAQSERLP